MTTKYDIEITQGTDLVIPFLLEDTQENKQDLTGYLVKLQIKRSSYSTTFLDELTSENSRIILKGEFPEKEIPKCIIECHWPNKITSKFPVGRHLYEMRLFSPSNYVSKLLKGNFIVKRGIIK